MSETEDTIREFTRLETQDRLRELMDFGNKNVGTKTVSLITLETAEEWLEDNLERDGLSSELTPIHGRLKTLMIADEMQATSLIPFYLTAISLQAVLKSIEDATGEEAQALAVKLREKTLKEVKKQVALLKEAVKASEDGRISSTL